MSTSFAELQFSKPIEQISEDDLVDYFSTERDESLTLEFKSYYAKENFSFEGVLRTVTAFLNSEGGLLVFGAPREVTVGDKYRVVKGDLTPIPTNVTTKDNLIRSISDNIAYMPIGIRVVPVSTHGGGFVYLIEVQESTTKPHQYKNAKQYLVRLDGQTIGAPHYLVEALFKQIKRPELKGYLRVTSYRIYHNPGDHFNTITLGFEATIFNVSKVINDVGVYMHLMSGQGMFIPGIDARHQFHSTGKRVTVLNAAALITDGLPTRHTFDYQITTEEFNAIEGRVLKFTLGFGGVNSATKFSYYSIMIRSDARLDPFEFGKVFNRPKDLNNLLEVEKEENVAQRWQGDEEERIELALNGI